LLTAPPEDAPNIVTALEREGIAAHVVGRVSEAAGVRLHTAGGVRPLPRPARDEIARLFE
jgi:hypothetical protein